MRRLTERKTFAITNARKVFHNRWHINKLDIVTFYGNDQYRVELTKIESL